MQTFHFPSGRQFERPHTCDATFWGFQAVMSQHILECEDVAQRHGRGDQGEADEVRKTATEEWSKAVRNGFVCC